MAQRLVLEAVGGDLCQRTVASHRLQGREQIPPRPFVSRLLPSGSESCISGSGGGNLLASIMCILFGRGSWSGPGPLGNQELLLVFPDDLIPTSWSTLDSDKAEKIGEILPNAPALGRSFSYCTPGSYS